MILYLDTETTGLRPGNICQLSYIMQTKEKSIAKNMFFTVDYVESGAQSVHGFSVEFLYKASNGIRFCGRKDEIRNDFESASVLVAHNTAFDFMFLGEEFNRLGENICFSRVLCSMKSMTPVLKLKRSNSMGYKYPKLSELCEYFGITEREINVDAKRFFGGETAFHDARFDATALYLAMNNAMEKTESMAFLKDFL